ncbi:response regulator [Streptomyces albulus]|nr:response regulator [Streptomyces noursei]
MLLDLFLPDGHGLQLLRTLRAAGQSADIIAVTSARDLAMVREGVSLGVVQYVLKPFTFATLRDRLLRYAEFRATSGRPAARTRWTGRWRRCAPAAGRAAQGADPATLRAVTEVLRAAADGLTATEAAADVGISRITARRYLEHLVAGGRAARAPQYGQVGRPELRYRWSGR